MTNEISNPLQQIIDAASKKAASIESKKITQRHAQKSNNSGKRFVLADISASMLESVGSATKYDLLKKALSDSLIDWKSQHLIAFSSIPEPCTSSTLPLPSGNTALDRAIKYISTEKPAFTLIITDGQPDDEQSALGAADDLTGIIDVLFIGRDNDFNAISFLKKLSARSGGRMFVRDLIKTKSLPSAALKKLIENH